jgi:ankyrin repeat protein
LSGDDFLEYREDIPFDINNLSPWYNLTPLQAAAKCGNLELTLEILQVQDLNILTKNRDNLTALDFSVQAGEFDVTSAILNRLEELKETCKNCLYFKTSCTVHEVNSPLLHKACQTNNLRICCLLLVSGYGSPDSEDNLRMKPIELTTNPRIKEILTEFDLSEDAGADVSNGKQSA